jgi:hypothetical protein
MDEEEEKDYMNLDADDDAFDLDGDAGVMKFDEEEDDPGEEGFH